MSSSVKRRSSRIKNRFGSKPNYSEKSTRYSVNPVNDIDNLESLLSESDGSDFENMTGSHPNKNVLVPGVLKIHNSVVENVVLPVRNLEKTLDSTSGVGKHATKGYFNSQTVNEQCVQTSMLDDFLKGETCCKGSRYQQLYVSSKEEVQQLKVRNIELAKHLQDTQNKFNTALGSLVDKEAVQKEMRDMSNKLILAEENLCHVTKELKTKNGLVALNQQLTTNRINATKKLEAEIQTLKKEIVKLNGKVKDTEEQLNSAKALELNYVLDNRDLSISIDDLEEELEQAKRKIENIEDLEENNERLDMKCEEVQTTLEQVVKYVLVKHDKIKDRLRSVVGVKKTSEWFNAAEVDKRAAQNNIVVGKGKRVSSAKMNIRKRKCREN